MRFTIVYQACDYYGTNPFRTELPLCAFFALYRSFYPSTSSTTSVRADSQILIRGTIVNRTYGHTKTYLVRIYLPFFTHNIWSYSLWAPVIESYKLCGHKTTPQRSYIVVIGTRVDNAMPSHHTGYERHDILVQIL